MTDPFDEPGTGGDFFNNAENIGRLLLITATEYISEFKTTAGTGPAVRADLVVLDGPDSPSTYEDALLFGKVFTGQLKRNAGTGRPNLGRLGQGEKKPGQSPPWVLGVPSDSDKQLARDYLAKTVVAPF